jgi:hypothetical protein
MPSAERAEPRREALIVAADAYGDAKLSELKAPAQDAAELARVLGDPTIGGFRVDVSLNEPDHVVRRRLSEFFQDRSRDDLLVLHISCHGLKDEDGTLFFASSNTEVGHLEATAIPSEFVNRQMTRSRSRRIVLLLDCCFGGAFARGMVHRAGEDVAVKEEFGGQGRVVLTASRAMEYAFEGDRRQGDAQPSIFTSAVVEALETGRADRDQDHRISVDELYDYVYERVREETPNQTPSKWTFDVHGDLFIARSSWTAEIEPAELPRELRAAMDSPLAMVRAGAVEELARVLRGSEPASAAAARLSLETLALDDSRRVSSAAEAALSAPDEAMSVAAALPVAGVRAPPEAPAPPPSAVAARSRTVGGIVARVADRQGLFALVGTALLVLAYFRAASWASGWYYARTWSDDVWAIRSPLEVAGSAALAGLALLGASRGRIGREAAEGAYVGVGAASIAATVPFANLYDVQRGGTLLTGLGGLCLVLAGLAGLAARRAPAAGLPRHTGVVVAAGVLLGLAPLVVNVAEWDDSSLFALFDGWAYAAEVLLLALVAAGTSVVLVRLPRLRLHAAGTLVGLGTILALHLVGIIVELAHEDGMLKVGLGAPLGIVGGILLVVAGARVLRAEREPEAPTAPVPAV